MNSEYFIQCSNKGSVRQFIQKLGLSKCSYTCTNTSIAAPRACNNHCFLIINTRIFWILEFRDVCTCVCSSKIMKQVNTSSDLHFIFFLELTQIILMAVLHGMVVVFLIFMGFTVSLASVYVLIRWKCIYNFLCSMLVLHQLLYVLFTLRGVFMHFLELTY
jgi:hypothetical protein